jgi:DNA replication and repair protein RecF
MHLSRLELDQFRLYSHMELDIPRPGLRISGRNASGKTSLLEALVMLSTTRSPRAAADREIVNWSSGSEYGVRPYVRIDAGFETRDGPGSAGIRLELDPERQSVIHKQFLLDSRPVRAHDSVGAIKCVLFSPEDVFLVSGAPSERRRQIDILISQCDRAYLTSLTQYGKVLSQRNQLLKQFARVRRSSRDIGAVTELSFWDEELVAAGSTVMAYRHMIAARIADLVRARSAVLVDDVELGFAYVPKLAIHWGSLVGEVKRDRDVVASQFQAAVEQARGWSAPR